MTRRVAKPPTPEGDKPAAPSPGVREHILDRTIYLMGTHGTTDVSVRAIAREAGVNVAAVNYYFSSKEQMLEQMSDRFLKGFGQVMQLLETPGLPPEERLRQWAAEVMKYLAEYPGVLSLMERQIAAEPLDRFGLALRGAVQQATRQMKGTLREMVGETDEQRLAFKLTLLISALAGPFPRQLDRGQERRGFRAPAKRARFLDLLLEHLRH
jgi:AcrR family transcriptional regulator